MLIEYKELFLPKMIQPGLVSSLAILVAFSTIVRAQQSQAQTLTPARKQTSLNSTDKQLSPTEANEPDDSEDFKLSLHQVQRVAEKILELRSVRTRAFEIARLADVLWKRDEPYARLLFEKALSMTVVNGSDVEARAMSVLHRRVIALIARSDAEWAKRLIDSASKHEAEEQFSKSSSATNIRTALGLVDDDTGVAVEFAERSLAGGVAAAFVDFILALRKKDEPEANRLFLSALNYLSRQPSVNIAEFHSLGFYLFTAPEAIDSDNRVLTRVEDMLVPNITVERPGVSPALVRAYLTTAADALWRTTSDAEQHKPSYALCYMLRVKSINRAPELTAKLDAVMAALAPQVPGGLITDSAYKYLNALPTTAEEQLTKAENKPDQESRDIAYLEIALQAWRKGDFKTARISQGRISDLHASQDLAAIIDFGEGAWILKTSVADVAKVVALANHLPQGIERSILLQAIAKVYGQRAETNLAEETIAQALRATRSISDGRRPFLLLSTAAQLGNLKSAAVHTAMAEVIKDFNTFDESALSKLDWVQSVQIGPLNARFPLDVANIDFDFNEAFRSVALADPEAALARADELRHESLRARGLVEVARAFLDKIPSRPPLNQQPIRVNEDGMRKSASKTVMPSYPTDALKNREQGVVIAEVQYDANGDVVNTAVLESPSQSIADAVVKAIKQWKFIPSKKEDGTPVSIRGKLTFYFEIDKDGRGLVLNPKQYR